MDYIEFSIIFIVFAILSVFAVIYCRSAGRTNLEASEEKLSRKEVEEMIREIKRARIARSDKRR